MQDVIPNLPWQISACSRSTPPISKVNHMERVLIELMLCYRSKAKKAERCSLASWTFVMQSHARYGEHRDGKAVIDGDVIDCALELMAEQAQAVERVNAQKDLLVPPAGEE